MDPSKGFEDKLREAACFGDEDAVRKILEKGVNVNSQHEINGWTALHWAAKRGHINIVAYLLSKGADKNVPTKKGELALALTDNEEIARILGGSASNQKSEEKLPIVANYIACPPLNYKVDVDQGPVPVPVTISSPAANMTNGVLTSPCSCHSLVSHAGVSNPLPSQGSVQNEELVVKIRIAHASDSDYIEVELPSNGLSYSRLLRVCCDELGVDPSHVLKIRKLPDTIVRKDKDVQRLNNFQELELVLSSQKFLDSRFSISPFPQSTNLNSQATSTPKPAFVNCKILY